MALGRAPCLHLSKPAWPHAAGWDQPSRPTGCWVHSQLFEMGQVPLKLNLS